MRGQPFRLVEFTFSQLQRMQRHRHDEIPSFLFQFRRGPAHEQIGEKIFKPQRMGILEPVNRLQHDAFGDDRRAGTGEMQLQFVAVRAGKFRGEIAGVGKAAAGAERWTDEAHLRPAFAANEAVGGRGALGITKLADLRVNQAQRGLQPRQRFFRNQHGRNLFCSRVG